MIFNGKTWNINDIKKLHEMVEDFTRTVDTCGPDFRFLKRFSEYMD